MYSRQRGNLINEGEARLGGIHHHHQTLASHCHRSFDGESCLQDLYNLQSTIGDV